MRVCVTVLGWTLDWSLEPTCADVDTEDDDASVLSGGTTGGYYVGFALHEPPDEAAIHHQCSPYEDDSEARR